MNSPVIVFDTSALSKLIKGGFRLQPYLSALTCGFDVWLTAMSVDELIATPVPETRETLIAGLQCLLASGRCVWPPHEVLTLLCTKHADDPSGFDWRKVDIRAVRYERAIVDREFTDDLCDTQLLEQRSVEKQYMDFWLDLRSRLQPLLGSEREGRPRSYGQAAEIARTGKVLIGLAKPLYERGSKIGINHDDVKAFLDACPPFRAVCYGLVGSWFDVSVASQVFKKLAGRNDQMMAAYLPYCSRFATDDAKQGKRLREIAFEAQLNCDVLSYKQFLESFDVVV